MKLARTNGNGYAIGGRNNASTPSQIKCADCLQVKPSINFSAKQLEIRRLHMRKQESHDPVKMPHIRCSTCTGQQVTELECFMCERWMGLDKFAVAQRKDPDHAECIKCVKERVEDEPYEAGRDAEEDTQYDEDDSASHGGSGSSEEDENTIHGATGSMGDLSLSGGHGGTYPSQNGSSIGGVSLTALKTTAPSSRQSTAATVTSTHSTRTKFNRSGYGKSSAAPSVADSKKSTGGAWAKIPKTVPKTKLGGLKTADTHDVDDEDKTILSDSD